MATIRMLATVCAALCAGLTLSLGSAELAPAAAQATTDAQPGAPLNLVPRVGKTKKFSKQTRTSPRLAKARTFLKPRTVAQAEPAAKSKTFRRAVQRRAPPTRTFARRAAPSRTFAGRLNNRTMPSHQNDAITQRQESVGVQAEAPVAPSASPWPGAPLATTNPISDYALASVAAASTDGENADTTADTTTEETFQMADAAEINEIDLAASEMPAPADKSWFNALLAVLGGAFAAASAARFLLA